LILKITMSTINRQETQKEISHQNLYCQKERKDDTAKQVKCFMSFI